MPGQSWLESSTNNTAKDSSLAVHSRTSQTLLLGRKGACLTELAFSKHAVSLAHNVRPPLPSPIDFMTLRTSCLGWKPPLPKRHQLHPSTSPILEDASTSFHLKSLLGARGVPGTGRGFRDADLVCDGRKSSPEYFSIKICFLICARVFFSGQ